MPLFYLIVSGYLSGTALFFLSAHVKSAAFLYSCLSGSFLILLTALIVPKVRQRLLVCTGVLCLGFVLAAASQLSAEQSAASWRKPYRYASLEGLVTSLPAVKLTGRRVKVMFTLRAERRLTLENDFGGSLPRAENLKLQEVSGTIQVFLVNPAKIPKPGDRVRIFGRSEPPRQALNPGEFDYAAYASLNHIDATFSGIGPAALRIIDPDAVLDWNVQIERIRGQLSQRLERAFSSSRQHAELLKALLLGLRNQLSQELWQVMMRTGTSHLISISGLHMSLFSGFVYTGLLFIFQSQKRAAVGAALALLGYMFLAGRGIPVQRAALMGVAVYIGMLGEREVQPVRLLAWACLIQLAQDPHAVQKVSFQLSFLSVLILLQLRYLTPTHWALGPIRATALVMAGTLPLAAWHFHLFSWTALIANLWAIPFFNFSLILGAGALVMADLPVLSWMIAKICTLCLDLGLAGLRFLAQWKYGWTHVAQPPMWKMIYYYGWAAGWFLAAGIFSHKITLAVRRLMLVGWLTAGVLFWVSWSGPSWSVTVLAGTRLPTVHIQSKHSHWLINTGQSTGGYDVTHRLLPYLKWRGIRRLEGVFVAAYTNEADFALSLLEEHIEVKKILSPVPRERQEQLIILNKPPGTWRRTHSSDSFLAGSLRIKILPHRRGGAKLIRITAESGITLFFILELDAETLDVLSDCGDCKSVICFFFGSAGGDQPRVSQYRRLLLRRMRPSIWVFAKDVPSVPGLRTQTKRIHDIYSLKDLGAVQISKVSAPRPPNAADIAQGGQIDLQFLSGHRVVLI